MKWRLSIVGFLAAGAAVLLLAACSSGGASEERVGAVEQDLESVRGEVQALSLAPVERFIEVTGYELKGSTSSTELAPPAINPEDLSDGFGFDAPGFDDSDSSKWRVASYIWSPGNMVAFQGDKLNLHFFIVNGNKHEVWVEGPDGSTVVDETEMNRGREYSFAFEASQPGVYRLVCNNHEPTMTAEIVVLPQS